MTLYDIDEKLQELFEMAVDAETGEITDEEAYAEFCNMDIQRDSKIENIGCWIKDLKAEVEAIENEIDALTYRRSIRKNKIASLENYLRGYLDGEKFESARLKVSYRRTSSVEADIEKIPEEYLKYGNPTANKTLLKKDLKAGKEIPGARIVEKQSMIIK